MRVFDFIVFLLLSTTWGIVFMFVKMTLDSFPPFTLVAIRLIASSIFLGLMNLGYAIVSRRYRDSLYTSIRRITNPAASGDAVYSSINYTDITAAANGDVAARESLLNNRRQSRHTSPIRRSRQLAMQYKGYGLPYSDSEDGYGSTTSPMKNPTDFYGSQPHSDDDEERANVANISVDGSLMFTPIGKKVHSSSDLTPATGYYQSHQSQPPAVRRGKLIGILSLIYRFSVMGLLNHAIPFVLTTIASGAIPSGIVSVLVSTEPLFGLLLAHVFIQGEKITIRRSIGIVAGFAGVIVLCLPGILDETDKQTWYWAVVNYSLVLIAALSFAAATTFAKRNVYKLEPLFLVFGQLTAGTFELMILWVALDYQFPPAGYSQHFAFFFKVPLSAWLITTLVLGVVCTGLTFLMYFYLLNRLGVVQLNMTAFLSPAVAVVAGAIVYSEWSNLTTLFIIIQVVGIFFILIGMGIVMFEPQPKDTTTTQKPATVVSSVNTTPTKSAPIAAGDDIFSSSHIQQSDEPYSPQENEHLTLMIGAGRSRRPMSPQRAIPNRNADNDTAFSFYPPSYPTPPETTITTSAIIGDFAQKMRAKFFSGSGSNAASADSSLSQSQRHSLLMTGQLSEPSPPMSGAVAENAPLLL